MGSICSRNRYNFTGSYPLLFLGFYLIVRVWGGTFYLFCCLFGIFSLVIRDKVAHFHFATGAVTAYDRDRLDGQVEGEGRV